MNPTQLAISEGLRRALVGIPSWIITLALFFLFLTISLGTRVIIRRRCSEERQTELSKYAGQSITGIAASFAFFVGFAITISWGALSAGQAAVENQAGRSQQLVWIIGNISDKPAADSMLGQLHTYLVTSGQKDGPYLERGNAGVLPSTGPLDDLQNSIHQYAFGPGASDPETGGLVDAAANLNAAAASVSAVEQRSLPPLMAVLILVTGGILAWVGGMESVLISRPLLLPVWCLLPALAITVIPGPGGFGIDLSPLLTVAERMVH